MEGDSLGGAGTPLQGLWDPGGWELPCDQVPWGGLPQPALELDVAEATWGGGCVTWGEVRAVSGPPFSCLQNGRG